MVTLTGCCWAVTKGYPKEPNLEMSKWMAKTREKCLETVMAVDWDFGKDATRGWSSVDLRAL